MSQEGYWDKIWKQFCKHRLGHPALVVVGIFALVGIYAPFLASSKPLFVWYGDSFYFPLFRYLFYTGFFTKRLDIFFNLLMFTFPLMIWFRRDRNLFLGILVIQFALFGFLIFRTPADPAANPALSAERQIAVQKMMQDEVMIDWNFDLRYETDYAKLNYLLTYYLRQEQDKRLQKYAESYREAKVERWKKHKADQTMPDFALPTLWRVWEENQRKQIERQTKVLEWNQTEGTEDSFAAKTAKVKLKYLEEKRRWLDQELEQLHFVIMPLIRDFHWEDDAGGEQSVNQYVSWWELSRINRKDLVAALIFGVRISLVVGLLAVGLAMMIGIPVGSLAGYYGGKFDIAVSRMLEIWESMPTFFMLLLVVAVTQSKSIFLVIAVVGVFGWTGFSRYIRGEFFKQRNLPYVEACHAQGFHDRYIIFRHILPNAIPPILTLLPFSIMGAITTEAGLSFLGLGEEGSCSWGVLMDEGRNAFPGESYLLWPPAILLTTLLIAIALVGDALRDALDPKMQD